MDPGSKRLRVVVTDGKGQRVVDGGLARWLSAVAPARACGEVAIALVSDGRIRTLNRRYRRHDRATDVLSFPAVDASHTAFRNPHSAVRRAQGVPSLSRDGTRNPAPFLGDIVIATGVARRQAREAGHPYTAELRILALHGLLHLLGYDHHEQRDLDRMRRVETRLRRLGGLSTGLIERSRQSGKTRQSR